MKKNEDNIKQIQYVLDEYNAMISRGVFIYSLAEFINIKLLEPLRIKKN